VTNYLKEISRELESILEDVRKLITHVSDNPDSGLKDLGNDIENLQKNYSKIHSHLGAIYETCKNEEIPEDYKSSLYQCNSGLYGSTEQNIPEVSETPEEPQFNAYGAYTDSVTEGETELNYSDEEGKVSLSEDKTSFLEINDDTQDAHKLSGWDEKFLEFKTNQNKKAEDYENITELVDNFFSEASTFTKMIVAEHHIKSIRKMIKPIDIGGVAGGTKFKVHGLFFKYPGMDPQLWY